MCVRKKRDLQLILAIIFVQILNCTFAGWVEVPYATPNAALKVVENLINNFPQDLYRELHFHEYTTPECARQSGFLIDEENVEKYEVVKVYDAMPKYPGGIFEGNLFWPGNFRQCLNSTIYYFNRYSERFDAQYCIVQVQFMGSKSVRQHLKHLVSTRTLNLLEVYPLKIGVCIPSSCTSKDVLNATIAIREEEALLFQTKNLLGNETFNYTVEDWDCQTSTSPKASEASRNIAYVIFATIVAIVAMTTIYDLSVGRRFVIVDEQEEQNPVNPENPVAPVIVDIGDTIHCSEAVKVMREEKLYVGLLRSFSLKNNLKEFFTTKARDHPFRCLDVLLSLSVMWLIASQTFMMSVPYFWNNLVQVTEFQKSILYSFFVNRLQAVDAMLFIQGAKCGIIKHRFEKGGRGVEVGVTQETMLRRTIRRNGNKIRTVLLLLGQQFLKWTFPYAIFLSLIIPFLPEVRGPLSGSSERMSQVCHDSWGANLLYISNFFPLNKMCYPHTWFLAVSMQFYLMTLILFQVWDVFYSTIVYVFMTCMVLWNIGMMLIAKSPFGIVMLMFADFKPVIDVVTDDFYTKPYSRVYPYIAGLVFGYMLGKTDTSRDNSNSFFYTCLKFLRTRKVTQYALFSVIFLPLTAGAGMASYTFMSGSWTSMMYSSELLLIILWPFALAWIVGVHAFWGSRDNFLRKISALNVFQYLRKLSISAYLIHHVVLQTFFSTRETPASFNLFILFTLICGFTCITYLLAFLMYICLELPARQWAKATLYYFDKPRSWCTFNWIWFGKCQFDFNLIDSDNAQRANALYGDEGASSDSQRTTDTVQSKEESSDGPKKPEEIEMDTFPGKRMSGQDIITKETTLEEPSTSAVRYSAGTSSVHILEKHPEAYAKVVSASPNPSSPQHSEKMQESSMEPLLSE